MMGMKSYGAVASRKAIAEHKRENGLLYRVYDENDPTFIRRVFGSRLEALQEVRKSPSTRELIVDNGRGQMQTEWAGF